MVYQVPKGCLTAQCHLSHWVESAGWAVFEAGWAAQKALTEEALAESGAVAAPVPVAASVAAFATAAASVVFVGSAVALAAAAAFAAAGVVAAAAGAAVEVVAVALQPCEGGLALLNGVQHRCVKYMSVSFAQRTVVHRLRFQSFHTLDSRCLLAGTSGWADASGSSCGSSVAATPPQRRPSKRTGSGFGSACDRPKPKQVTTILVWFAFTTCTNSIFDACR